MEVPTDEFETIKISPGTGFDPGKIPTHQTNDCPALNSQLYQLTKTEDALLKAVQLGYKIRNDKLQVLVVLAGEESGFLLDYGVEIGKQSGNQVQVYAPLDQLCALAKVESVVAIHPAAQAVLP